METTLKLKPCNFNIKKNTFILSIIILQIFFYIETILFIIPGITALILYLKKKNLSHNFFFWYGIFIFILTIVKIFLLIILEIWICVQIFNFDSKLDNEIRFEYFYLGIVYVFFSFLVNIIYLVNLPNFRLCINEDRNRVRDGDYDVKDYPKMEEEDSYSQNLENFYN